MLNHKPATEISKPEKLRQPAKAGKKAQVEPNAENQGKWVAYGRRSIELGSSRLGMDLAKPILYATSVFSLAHEPL